MSTAGILIIGNEILSGKVQDENAPFLLRELRALGVEVLRVNTIPDVVEVIARDVREFSQSYGYVITSGGVGPTHDDVTMEGVAAAFGRKIVRHPRMDEMLRDALRGRDPNASHLKMTELPEGAELIETPDLWFPLVKVENVFVFPGIPRLLQAKFTGARDRFVGQRIFLRNVFLACIETDIALDVNALVAEFPALQVGSYPRIGEDSFRTLITLESRDEAYVLRALDAFVGRIPADYVIRVE
jgi:molybdenum cofactor synthesis domain-containing protein